MTGITSSELAERAGVNTSTVRYYERAGLVPDPERAANGYRTYTPHHETRLLFITRARNLGLSIDQIAAMLGIWDASDCTTTRSHTLQLSSIPTSMSLPSELPISKRSRRNYAKPAAHSMTDHRSASQASFAARPP